MYRIIILATISILSFADNNIYQYIDKNGNLTVSNKPKANNLRFQILLEELDHENKSLIEAQNLLAESIKPGNSKENPEHDELLKTTIKEHQKNIKILNKQLGY